MPWFSFFSDALVLQLLIVYTLFIIINTTNLYYVLFYIILQIIFFGLFLSLYQLEIFTAFLWLTEVVVILVCLFLLFNTSPSGNINKPNNFPWTQKTLGIFIPTVIVSLNFTHFSLADYSVHTLLLSSSLWDNYYEALNNENLNDLYGLFLSYYWLNSVEFVLIGTILLIGSLACVQLNKFLKTNKTITYLSFFDIYDYFKDLTKILFMRKQNLVDQATASSSTRIFKKKNKETKKKTNINK